MSSEYTGINDSEAEFTDDFDSETMANLIGKPLSEGQFQYRVGQQPSSMTRTDAAENAKPIVHITGPYRSETYPITEPMMSRWVCQRSWYICWQYTDY
jgi:hypothetical protein